MELWIRSQDKKILGKYNDIAVRRFIDEDTLYSYQIVGYFDKDTEFEVLGVYSKEERALEVLDQIDDIKFKKYMASLDFDTFIETIKDYSREKQIKLLFKMNTYEMPEE